MLWTGKCSGVGGGARGHTLELPFIVCSLEITHNETGENDMKSQILGNLHSPRTHVGSQFAHWTKER